jgi:hypothetical protein
MMTRHPFVATPNNGTCSSCGKSRRDTTHLGNRIKKHHDKLRDLGEADFLAGKSIDAFYQVPIPRHTELERGSYEVGWRAAKAEQHACQLLGLRQQK